MLLSIRRRQDDSWCDPFKTAVAIFAADPLEGFKSEADMNRVSQQQHPSPAAFAATSADNLDVVRSRRFKHAGM